MEANELSYYLPIRVQLPQKKLSVGQNVKKIYSHYATEMDILAIWGGIFL